MKNISFSLTTPQVLDRSKTVTRRLGWNGVKVGEFLQAIEKGQGLKKGQKVRKLHVVRVLSARREPLKNMQCADLAREGFPGHSLRDFIAMFCEHNACTPRTIVTRIEFDYPFCASQKVAEKMPEQPKRPVLSEALTLREEDDSD
jgi:hypothetical protein